MESNFINKLLNSCAKNNPYSIAIRQIKKGQITEISYSEILNKIHKNRNLLNDKTGKLVVLYLSSTIESHILLYSCLYYGVVPLIKTYNYDNFNKRKLVDDFNILCHHYTDIFAGYIIEEDNHELIIHKLKNQNYKMTSDLSNIAFIQLSSGTTGFQKGIKSSYNALYNNLIKCKESWNLDQNSKILSWLSISHNFGFITSILLPIFTGAENTIISPKDFYYNPNKLLHLLAEFETTHTFLPNFALGHIIQDITGIDNLKLNLSNLKVIGIGGDFIKKSTIDNFYNKLKKYNLDYSVFKAVYGMSENSGIITMTSINEKIEFYDINKNNFICPSEYTIPETNVYIANVGKIYKNDNIKIKINNKLTKQELHVGEIVVSTNSLFDGYLQDSTKINQEDEFLIIDNTKYFNTGDLGFLYNGCLYIIGRKKDIIVIRGKNFSSNIIENTILKDLTMKDISIVVLSINNDNILYVLIETQNVIPKRESKIIKESVIKSLKDNYNFDITEKNIIIKNNFLPKTITNKINRQACKQMITEGD